MFACGRVALDAHTSSCPNTNGDTGSNEHLFTLRDQHSNCPTFGNSYTSGDLIDADLDPDLSVSNTGKLGANCCATEPKPHAIRGRQC